jgi:Zn-dependent peptidase ImmA (M78 family)/transcriptional regulator with XRE-family HTH domain
MTTEPFILEAVFGNESTGATPEQRAQTSTHLFVRSQHQLSQYRNKATGRILSASESLRLFGWEILKELADHPATPILRDAKEPYRSINAQLDRLGLSLSETARKVGWSNVDVRQFEQRRQVPFRALERMAQGIDLDENKLGIVADAGADNQLSVRLKKSRKDDPKRFTVNTVLALTEAAWTIRKQMELAVLIGESPRKAVSGLGFLPSNDYGSRLSPDYKKGYELAGETRKLLGLSAHEPVSSLKELIEKKLSVPVIQMDLHHEFAGATVASGDDRGLVINLQGDNRNPHVQRMTMAHELGHLLWDPDQKLNKLRVDRYDEIGLDVAAEGQAPDRVERRANAFAVEFLAPGDAIKKEFNKKGGGVTGLAHIVDLFGVSRTAIMHHLSNASHNTIGAVEGALPDISLDVWEARETLAVPLFRPEDVPVSRRGRFAYYIYEAHKRNLISDDTAASLFKCKPEELNLALKTTEDYLIV